MLEEFGKIANELWEQKKPPLEKMYDRWTGKGNWEPEKPQNRYAIYSIEDVEWRGHQVLAGRRFPCHLCGKKDQWTIEGDDVTKQIRVFICEHEPISTVRGGIRQISSVPARMVARFEKTHQFLG